METLRLHSPSPTPQRRIVPKGGAVIDGYFIPAGVTISSLPYALHRHVGAYPEPEEWKPERWMNAPSAKKTQRSAHEDDDRAESDKAAAGNDNPRRWFWSFGSGTTMCLGSNFALVGKCILRRTEPSKKAFTPANLVS